MIAKVRSLPGGRGSAGTHDSWIGDLTSIKGQPGVHTVTPRRRTTWPPLSCAATPAPSPARSNVLTPALLALVEDFMRVEIGTVDALPPGGFVMLARQSLANVTTWRQAGRIRGQVQAEHCPATGLDYPNDWQSAPGTVAGERT